MVLPCEVCLFCWQVSPNEISGVKDRSSYESYLNVYIHVYVKVFGHVYVAASVCTCAHVYVFVLLGCAQQT